MDWTIRALRKRLEADATRPEHLLTDQGTGYRLVARPATPPLPRPPWPLIGRRALVDEVIERLQPGRIVVIGGTGGIGKSRIALAVARRLGAAWVPLAPEGAPIAPPEGAATIVLDGAEATPELPERLVRWRQQRPDRAWLVTTQGPLAVDGAHRIDAPPLDEDDAVALLRMLARRRGIALGQAPCVRTLCRRLQGVPLAIELSAAWLGVRSIPRQLRERADLPTRSRDVSPQQQRLSESVAWTWSLLSEPLRRTIRALAIVEGAIDGSVAERVAGAGAGDRLAAIESWGLARPHPTGLVLYDAVRRYASACAPDREAAARWDRWLLDEARRERLGADRMADLAAAVARTPTALRAAHYAIAHPLLLRFGQIERSDALGRSARACAVTAEDQLAVAHGLAHGRICSGDLRGARPDLERALARADRSDRLCAAPSP